MKEDTGSIAIDAEPIVYVIDDDQGVRKSVLRIMESVGLDARVFSSVDEFLAVCPDAPVGCVVTDLRMPHKSGLELQKELRVRGVDIPVIFMTAYADVKTGVHVMKQGGFDFLEKPFNNQELIDLVQRAIQKSLEDSEKLTRMRDISAVLDMLSEQERMVLDGVMDGKLNKTMAVDSGLSEKTIEYHRAKVMKKFNANSIAELVKIICSIGPQ